MGELYLNREKALQMEDTLSPFALKAQKDNINRINHLSGRSTAGSDRSEFDHDRDRILNCRHFRRLSGKTQMFIAPNNTEQRTRLTHTMAVYQLATSIGRRFNANISALEAMCFGHDLGHPPFGHSGESVLNRYLAPFGGFHHAAQSIRVVDRLEYNEIWSKEESTTGLNLTYSVREGILLHGWFNDRRFTPYHYCIPAGDSRNIHFLGRNSHGSLEAQILKLSDNIAYLNHDIEDLINFGLESILSPGIINRFFDKQDSSIGRNVKETFIDILAWPSDQRIKKLVRDVCDASKKNVLKAGDKIDISNTPLIDFSPEMRQTRDLFYPFFRENIYSDIRICKKRIIAERYISDLFEFFYSIFKSDTDRLPWHINLEDSQFMETYFAKLNADPNYKKWLAKIKKRQDYPKKEKDDWRCAFAAADIVSSLTDGDAIVAVEELQHPHSYRGMSVIEQALASFPNENRWDNNASRIDEERKRLKRYFMSKNQIDRIPPPKVEQSHSLKRSKVHNL